MRRSAVLLPAIAVLAFSVPADVRTRRAATFDPGIAVTGVGRAAAPVAIAPDRIAAPRPMISEWALEADARAGLGLFRVNRFSRREVDVTRNAAIRDVGARTQRMPRVGLNLRFRTL